MADVTLPQLGETVTEGTITQWFKNVGDTVAADEPLFEVSTDKVDTEVPSPVSGVLTEIRVQEGDTVDVGTVIAVVGDADSAADESPAAEPEAAPAPEPEPEPAQPAPQAQPETQAQPAAEPEPAQASPTPPPPPAAPAAPTVPAESPAAPSPSTAQAGDNRLLSPVVRRLVNEHGLEPDAITGSGPGGRITRDDVLDHIDATGANRQDPAAAGAPEPPAAPSAPTPPPAPSAPPAPASPAPAARPAASAPSVSPGERDTTVPLSKIRRLTGDHMVMSKATSPHAFSVVEIDFANVDVVRTEVKDDWKSTHGFSLTYLPFIARAVIDALE